VSEPESVTPEDALRDRPLLSGVDAWLYHGRHHRPGRLRRLWGASPAAWTMLTGPTHHDYQD
jgi:hypothetical protein